MKHVKFGSGEISAHMFSLPLDEFLEHIMLNKSMIHGLSEDDAKKALTELYNSVNGIKNVKPSSSKEKVSEPIDGTTGDTNS